MLKTKSKAFAKEFGVDDDKFKASNGWFDRWRVRMGVKFKRAHGEKNSADVPAAENWIENRLPELLQNFDENQIYNADETGLFFIGQRPILLSALHSRSCMVQRKH